MTLPDFMCIGAQKAGTTWLDFNLRSHPDIWLPPAKEIHYFNRPAAPYVSGLFDRDPIRRRQVITRTRIAAREVVRRLGRPRDARYALGWYGRFLFQRRDDDWYKTLFAPGPGQVAGDVTPGYALLNDADVSRIQRLMPQVKMIYLIRNPIERVWSQIRMRFSRHGYRGFDTVASDIVDSFLRDGTTFRHSTYTQTLATWERFFPAEQLFVGFFDQLAEQPAQLLLDIYRFLGVAANPEYISPKVSRRIFPGDASVQLPDDLRRAIAGQLADEIEALHARFANPFTDRWQRSLEQAR